MRVQRVPSDWPLVHLEAGAPNVEAFTITGLVRHRLRLSLAELVSLGEEEREIPTHCVWGWSRPRVSWRGVSLAEVLALTEPLPTATHAVVTAASGVYSSCLPLDDVREGFLARGRDGEALCAEAGGPLRFVAPPTYWAYKHVKWATQVELVDRFSPGPWELKVADPLGRIPEDVRLP